MWEVAAVEKIPFEPKYGDLLKDCVAHDQSKAHTNPTLAAKGWRLYYHVKNKATTETMYHDDSNSASAKVKPEDVDDFEHARQAIKQASIGRCSGMSSAPLQDLGATSSKASKWKSEADLVIKELSDAEIAATSFEADINNAIEKKSNPALQKKHATLAANWAKKLANKKGHVMKHKTLASNAREELFDKNGNKFDEALKASKDLIEEWQGEESQTLLNKLIDF